MRIKSKLREKDIVIILFLLFFVFQFIQIFRFNFFVQSDDFGYIANAAFFAGYNWNPYTGNMTQYFNIGFPFFASFAFKLFHTLETVYQCLLFVIVVWQTLLMYLVYKMLGRFLDTGKTEAAVIALLYSMGTMAPQNGLYFMSEIPFAFCFILVLYLMLEAGNSEGKRQKMMSALSGLIVAFSYAVHTRFLVLAGTVILVCILYHLAYKKKLIHYLSFSLHCFLLFLQSLSG